MKRYASKLWLMVLTLITLSVTPAFAQRVDQTYTVRGTQIVFQAEVDWAQETQGAPLIVQPKQWSTEDVAVLFYEGKNVQVTTDYDEYDGSRSVSFEWNGITSWMDAHGSLTYKANDSLLMAGLMTRSIREYGPEGAQIPGLSAQEAEQVLRDRVSALRLEAGAVIRLKTLNQDWWRTEYEAMYIAGGERAAKSIVAPDQYIPPQEGYWIRVSLCLDGVPLMREYYESKKSNEYIDMSLLDAYVTRDGIELFETVNLAYEIVERLPAQTLLTPEQAIEAFLKRYEKLVVKDAVVVERIAYEYVPVPVRGDKSRFEARPAWCFYTEGNGSSFGGQDYTVIYLDALTGEEIT